jgi:hypothetical protein
VRERRDELLRVLLGEDRAQQRFVQRRADNHRAVPAKQRDRLVAEDADQPPGRGPVPHQVWLIPDRHRFRPEARVHHQQL